MSRQRPSYSLTSERTPNALNDIYRKCPAVWQAAVAVVQAAEAKEASSVGMLCEGRDSGMVPMCVAGVGAGEQVNRPHKGAPQSPALRQLG